MKRILVLLLSCLLLVSAALAEDIADTPEGWVGIGYPEGGVTFMIPKDVVSWQLYESEIAAGVLFVGENDDCTIQLRRFEPDVMTVEQFAAILDAQPESDWRMDEKNGIQVLRYRNPAPTNMSELYGIAITGLDGYMYKISIFTGNVEDCSEDAPVWAIAEQIADSVQQMDFSDWPLE